MTNQTAQKETIRTLYSTKTLRKGLRAYIGMYGAAYERIQPVFEKAAKDYDVYAKKGEKLELVAQTYVKDTRVKATKTYGTIFDKVRAVLPNSANDRVVELEDELEALNAKLVKLTKTAKKKAIKKATTSKAKTETVVQNTVDAIQAA